MGSNIGVSVYMTYGERTCVGFWVIVGISSYVGMSVCMTSSVRICWFNVIVGMDSNVGVYLTVSVKICGGLSACVLILV